MTPSFSASLTVKALLQKKEGVILRFQRLPKSFWKGAERIRSAIHFDYINKVKTKSINIDTKDETLSLLTIRFESKKKPSGSIILEFSGNKAINLETENIEAFLTDVGDPWEVKNKPDHDKD